MGLYHFSADIIGRSSGRSAVGAAAYRAADKLQSVAHSAYQSGEKLYDIGDKITHDYTRKRGVVHSEIILPEGTPEEFQDRETLWNAVETKSKRIDAQLAREIEVALQTEFDLEEQKEILREYIRGNFASKGMIADFAIHDKEDGNPHAHIMLTLRNVSRDGFGNINRDWSTTAELVKWRENWADINNRKFEQKELDERIDHRTLRAQGIDREPTIHMGHEATALERRGTKTERGDINREINRRNKESAAIKAAQDKELEKVGIKTEHDAYNNEMRHDADRTALNSAKYKLLQEEREAQKIIQGVRDLEEQLKAAQAELLAEKIHDKRKTVKSLENIALNALHMLERAGQEPDETLTDKDAAIPNEVLTKLKTQNRMIPQEPQPAPDKEPPEPQEEHIKELPLENEKIREKRELTAALKISQDLRRFDNRGIETEEELNRLKDKRREMKESLPRLHYRAELFDEHTENIDTWQTKTNQLKAERQKLFVWNVKRKKELDKAIELAEGELRVARHYFEKHFRVKPENAHAERERLQEVITQRERALQATEEKIAELTQKLEIIDLERQKFRILLDIHPKKQQIEKILERPTSRTAPTHERKLNFNVERDLHLLSERDFQKILDRLPQEQVEAVLNMREQSFQRAETERRLRQEHERTRGRSYGRSR